MRSPWPIFRTTAVWLLILVLAGMTARHRAEQLRVAMTQQLLDWANRCAIAFVTEDTRALTGTRADLATGDYLAVKDRLQRLRAVTPDVRFIYLFRSTTVTGRVVFLADSEPAQSAEESLPGDDYPEAINSPGLQSILLYHRSSIEGPLRDSFGEWMTAYALVGNPPAPGTPTVVLGLDMNVSTWQGKLWKTGLTTFSFVLLLLGVPFGIWMFLHRERQLGREIRRLSAAIQQSHSMVLITDVERKIEYANDGCTAATGYAVDELIGQPIRLLMPEDASGQEHTDLRETLLQGRRWQGELRIRRRNGEIFPARAVFSPVRNQDGTIINLVGVIDDVSEQKKIEDAYRVARDQAETADRAKGEFLAMMSHELRTPLNGIIGFAALLQDTTLSSEQSDFANTIRTSGESLLTLTNELLDYSRIDAGRMQLDPQTCSLRLLIEEAAELLSARAAEKNLELLVSVASDVPAFVITDPGRLRQVLVNLLGNAIKFTPAGEVDVAVTVRPLQIHPSRMRLHVT
ncbi:MAG: PAS domain S-box protein, partial [Candidatus Didemnitutus sp.]|nr:PAS domain S-box protein [Candidatus Didemnitutus sp.]